MDDEVEVSAMAINVAVPEHLQWTDSRRGEEFLLTTLNVRMLPDGTLAAKAYGRPTAGGRGAYTSFRMPDSPELRALVEPPPPGPRSGGPPTAASPEPAGTDPRRSRHAQDAVVARWRGSFRVIAQQPRRPSCGSAEAAAPAAVDGLALRRR